MRKKNSRMPNPAITISISVDTASANSNVVKFNKGLSDIETVAKRASSGATQGISQIERSAARAAITITNQFSALKSIVQAAIGATLIEGAKSLATISAFFESSEIGLRALVREGENARQLFKDLQAFSQKSPFEFDALLGASQQLIAIRTEATKVVPTLQSLSTAIYAITGGRNASERLNDFILTLGQIKAAGALTGEEFRQLRNTGLPVLDILQEKFGKTAEEIRKGIVDRLIPAERVIPALLEGLQERFGKFGNEIEKTTSVAFSNFRDTVKITVDQTTREYLPLLVKALKDVADGVASLGKFLRENKGEIESFGEALKALGVVIATYKLTTVFYDLARGAAAFAGGLNPIGLAAGALAILGYTVYKLQGNLEDLHKADQEAFNNSMLFDEVKLGRSKEELQKLGFSVEQIQKALQGKGLQAKDPLFDASEVNKGLMGIRLVKEEQKSLYEFQANAAKERERIQDAEKRAAELLQQAQRREFTGLADIIAEYKVYRAELGLSTKANRDLAEAARIRLAAEGGKELRKNAEDRVNAIREEFDNFQQFEIDKFRARQEFEQETLNLGTETSRLLLDIQERGAEARRDAELRQLELLDDQTVSRRIAIEARRSEIEEAALRQSLTRKARNLDLELEYEIATLEVIGRARGLSEDEINARREALQRLSLAKVKQISEETEDAIAAARETAAVRSARAVQQNNLRVFEGLKRNVEGLFDAVVTRSKSFGQAIGDAIKLPILAALKEIVSTKIAAFLFEIFGGGKVNVAAGGQPQFSGGGIGVSGRGNVLGRLLGIGGAGALGLGSGGGGGFSSVIPGAPGGTGGFAGPVALGGGTGGAGAGVSSGVTGSLAGSAASLKGILSSLGNIGRGGAVLGPGSNGGALAQPGVGGAAGGAMLLGGATLAYMGLRRGGLSGLAMTTAGGALIGAKFGGPIGAAIGAGIGAVAGTIRLFIKGAEEKIVQKVKSVYGVDIARKFARDPLLGIIKQTFGGNIDVGIRSPQIRDLIELYAMSTGQNSQGINTTRPTASSFALSGGSFTQQPVFQNGLSMGLGQASNAAPAATVIQLDPAATEAFLQGQAVQAMSGNPRAVQGAVLRASTQNAGRRQALALAVNPGLMVG